MSQAAEPEEERPVKPVTAQMVKRALGVELHGGRGEGRPRKIPVRNPEWENPYLVRPHSGKPYLGNPFP